MWCLGMSRATGDSCIAAYVKMLPISHVKWLEDFKNRVDMTLQDMVEQAWWGWVDGWTR